MHSVAGLELVTLKQSCMQCKLLFLLELMRLRMMSRGLLTATYAKAQRYRIRRHRTFDNIIES
jgi:hypothetical protein